MATLCQFKKAVRMPSIGSQFTIIPGIAPGIFSYALFLNLSPSSNPLTSALSPVSSSRSLLSLSLLLSSSTSLLAYSLTSLSTPLTASTTSSSADPGPLVFFFRGHKLGSTTCCTLGSTHLSSIQAWSLLSTSCAILGMSCSREREPTRERTLRSRR